MSASSNSANVNPSPFVFIENQTTQEKEVNTQFQEAMGKAEGIFARLGTTTKEEKDAMVDSLNIAWQALATQRSNTSNPNIEQAQALPLARIALLWGQCRWCAVDMEVSRQAFSLSLLCARKQFDKLPDFGTDTIEQFLERLKSNPNTFSYLEETELQSETLVQRIIEESYADTNTALAIADAARQLGGTYQNHSNYKPKPDEDKEKENKIVRCEQIIKIAEAIWQHINSLDTQWALITCRYNTGPFLYSLRHSDIEGKIKIINEVLEKIELIPENQRSSKIYQQKAQCYNMLAILSKGEIPNNKDKIFEHLNNAAKIADEYAGKGFDQFLSRMFLNNRAGFAFRYLKEGNPIEGISIETMREWSEKVVELSAQHGFSHYYDGIFCLNAARIAWYQGDREAATKHANQALIICRKNSSSTHDILEDLHKFCKENEIELKD